MTHPRAVRILYRNHRHVESWRTVVPQRLWRGATEWHPQEQWLMDAWDCDKGAPRTFAMADVIAWLRPEAKPS